MADHIRSTHAVRLGLRQIIGAREEEMRKLVEARGAGYDSVRDLWLRGGISLTALERLADADAFRSLGLDRREALWAVRALNRVGDQDDLPLFAHNRPERDEEPDAKLAADAAGRACGRGLPASVAFAEGASRRLHARAARRTRGIKRSDALDRIKSGERVVVAGLVLVRQRPGTSKGVIFMTLEDETGVANIIVWPKAFERLRAIVIGARFVAVSGKLQNEMGVIHIIAERMEDLTPMLGQLSDEGRDIVTLAPSDEVRRPQLTIAQKRQGNRFAQVQLFSGSPGPPPEPQIDARRAAASVAPRAEFSLSVERRSAPPRTHAVAPPSTDRLSLVSRRRRFVARVFEERNHIARTRRPRSALEELSGCLYGADLLRHRHRNPLIERNAVLSGQTLRGVLE